jgi:hypothetical protein
VLGTEGHDCAGIDVVGSPLTAAVDSIAAAAGRLISLPLP